MQLVQFFDPLVQLKKPANPWYCYISYTTAPSAPTAPLFLKISKIRRYSSIEYNIIALFEGFIKSVVHLVQLVQHGKIA